MTANSDQIDFWNGQAGETWVRSQDRLDKMLNDLSDIALTKAATRPGERVLDVGCGCGATSLVLAEQGGLVHGVDISAPMLAHARQRATNIENLSFTEADAATHNFEGAYQLVFSRFGVMFFEDPFVAFKNLHAALVSDGRLVFMCWQSPANNPWVSTAGRAIAPFLDPTEPPDPKAPGPFAFADENYLRDILHQANFKDIEIESVTLDLLVGSDLESAMRFQGEVGPLARALTELSDEKKAQALDAVHQVFSAQMTPSGLKLGGATWLVSAKAS